MSQREETYTDGKARLNLHTVLSPGQGSERPTQPTPFRVLPPSNPFILLISRATSCLDVMGIMLELLKNNLVSQNILGFFFPVYYLILSLSSKKAVQD